jgi:PAS domain-containing protein
MSKKPLKTDNSINNKPGKKKNSSYNPGKLIVNEINEPLIIWDKNQRISFANQAAQKIFRLPIEDILNKPFGFPESIIEERVVDKDNILRYFDVIPIIMLALDVKGVITLINKKGCELIGCGENKTIGVNWFDNFVPEDVRKELKNSSVRLL